MAPELISSDSYDYSIDIWSTGIVLLELLNGNPPYIELPGPEAIVRILNNPSP